MEGYGIAIIFGAVQAKGGFIAGSAGTVLWIKSKQVKKDDNNGGTAVATNANVKTAMPNISENGYESNNINNN